MPMHHGNFNSYIPTSSSQSTLAVPKFLTESRSNQLLKVNGLGSQPQTMDNSRVINLGLEDDNNSIQNQEVDVTIPDSVDDRSGMN